MSGGHGPSVEGNNKHVALLIAMLALCLAFSEMLGKNAEKASMQANIEASNLWAFFQAKTIRRTSVQAAAEHLKITAGTLPDDATKAAAAKQIDDWQKAAARYRSEPETNEGSEQLAQRAKKAEYERDKFMAKYHHYEVASAAFQIGIVLASATIITGMTILVMISGGLAIVGLGFMGIGLFAPHAVHLF